MEERKLYPIKFCTLQDDYSWGSEEFKLADLGYRDSLVREGWLAGNSLSELMDTYMDRISGDNSYEYYGRQFPTCVRLLKVRGKMPLRVHPDDDTAGQRYDFLGKDKLWYVLRTGKDARIGIGMKQSTDAETFFKACLDSSVDGLLNIVAPHAGQSLRIRPGTVHYAEGDMDILEIAQSSPMDFCLCPWGRPMEDGEFDPSLTLADALDFIDYRRFSYTPPEGDTLADCEAFTITRMKLDSPVKCNNSDYGSFILYSCIKGAASLQLDILGQTAAFPVREGETMLVPAECEDFVVVPTEKDTVLLETTSDRIQPDSYTGDRSGSSTE